MASLASPLELRRTSLKPASLNLLDVPGAAPPTGICSTSLVPGVCSSAALAFPIQKGRSS